LLLTFLTLPVWLAVALAQDPSSVPANLITEEDGSRFGRLRYLDGQVTLAGRAGVQGPEVLDVNVPVLAGDQLSTGEGRAEIQLPDGSLLRLDQATEMEIMAIADLSNQWENRTVLRLASGSTYLLVEKVETEDDVFRVDTPSASIFVLTRGIFRVDVSPDGYTTALSSHSGVAEMVSDGASVLVRSGERTDVTGERAPTQPRPFNYFRQDEFDRWNRDRQGAYVKAYEHLPAQEVPEEVRPHLTELAYYGDWIEDPEYGWVWQPYNVDADWSPYLVGRWYGAPAGWTWVSYEPWGWAPYHYGRWHVSVSLGWFWIPGRVYSGGWVHWGQTGAHIGWCAMDYYNHPVTVGGHHGGRRYRYYPHRSWVFVPKDHFYSDKIHKVAVPALRTEEVRDHSVPLDVSRAHKVVPGLRGSVRRTSGGPQPSSEDGQRVSFRTLEGHGRVLTRPSAPRDGRSGRTAPSVRRVGTRQTLDSGDPHQSRPVPGSASPRAGRDPRSDRRATGAQSPPFTRPRTSSPPARKRDGSTTTNPRRPRTSPPTVGRPAEDDRSATRQGTDSKPRVIRVEDRGKVLQQVFKRRGNPARTVTPRTSSPAAPKGTRAKPRQSSRSQPKAKPSSSRKRKQSGRTTSRPRTKPKKD
jgi:hypothetical protein